MKLRRTKKFPFPKKKEARDIKNLTLWQSSIYGPNIFFRSTWNPKKWRKMKKKTCSPIWLQRQRPTLKKLYISKHGQTY